MPAVTMRRRISGKRNGRDWPKPGETIDVPEDEARTLVRLGLAAPDESEPDADETAAADETGAEADEPVDEQPEDEDDEQPEDEDDEEESADEADDFDSMKLPELRELAAERGLPTSGNKPALIERLRGE